MQDSDSLPSQLHWNGSRQPASFTRLLLNSGQRMTSYSLVKLLESENSLAAQVNLIHCGVSTKLKRYTKDPIVSHLKQCNLQKISSNIPSLIQLQDFKKAAVFQRRLLPVDQKPLTGEGFELSETKRQRAFHKILNQDSDQFKRMKTVFGHAKFNEGNSAPVYNCKFDLNDQVIITGADDGIIKIWSKDTLALQASLHGHTDMIIDIQVSKCNRYFASGSNDGTIIFWDLQDCSIIHKREQDHTSQVNSVQFIMVECDHSQTQRYQQALQSRSEANNQFDKKSKKGSKIQNNCNQKCFNQFMYTCSDDGCILIYDISSINKNNQDEFYTKSDKLFNVHKADDCVKKQESQSQQLIIETFQEITGEKIQKEQDSLIITDPRRGKKVDKKNGGLFFIKLRPDDFRLGSKNKHIDSVTICGNSGLVAGGTNYGELFLWKVNFNSIRQRSTNIEFQEWIGSFKIHKKGIHQLSFGFNGQVLISGSGDGTAKLWNTDFKSLTNENLKKCPERYNDIDFIEGENGNLKSVFNAAAEYDESHEYLIDAVEWSCNQRFLYCATSIKKIQISTVNDNNSSPKIPESSQATTGIQRQPSVNRQQGPNINDQLRPKDKEQNQAIVKIVVYDCQVEKVISNDLALDCGYQKSVNNYACLIKSHPYDDFQMIGSFDGGLCLIFDLKHMTIIQEIIEYGIYSIDQYTMNNHVDIDWSHDANEIALSSYYGTLSVYSNQKHKERQYASTRVHQFFYYDTEMHDQNLYEHEQSQPQICSYEMNPHEFQPDHPIIGRFKHKNQQDELTSEEFIHNQKRAIIAGQIEETFIQDQLNEGIRNGNFNSREPEGPAIPESPEPVIYDEISEDQIYVQNDSVERLITSNQQFQRQVRLTGQERVDNNLGLQAITDAPSALNSELFAHDRMGSDDEVLATNQVPLKRRLRRVQGAGGIEDDEESQNNEGDEFFEDYDSSEVKNDSNKEIAEDSDVEMRPTRRQRIVSDSDIAIEPSANGYLDKAKEQYEEEELEIIQQIEQRNQREQRAKRRTRRTQVVNSGDTSHCEEAFDDKSNYRGAATRSANIRNQTREEPQQIYSSRTRNRLTRANDLDISIRIDNHRNNRLFDDNSHSNNDQTNERATRRSNRNRLGRSLENQVEIVNQGNRRLTRMRQGEINQSRDRFNESFSDNAIYSNEGFQKKHKVVIQSDEEIQDLETPLGQNDIEEEGLIATCKLDCGDDLPDNYSQRGKGKYCLIPKEGKFPKSIQSDDQNEFDLILHQSGISARLDNVDHQVACAFCFRTMDQSDMIGPFFVNPQTRDNDLETDLSEDEFLRSIISSKQGFYFHRMCLENNEYVKYIEDSDYKWSGIAKALRIITRAKRAQGKTFSCYRCLQPGATCQCISCDRSFHGHYCCSLYMLPQDYSNETFQCIFCRNDVNFEQFKTNADMMRVLKTGHEKKRKQIVKTHLLETRAYTANGKTWYFQPQIGDSLVYFYQGHERFIQLNNCFFYAGDKANISSGNLPWMRHQQLKNPPDGRLNVKVINLENKFASRKATALIEKYGDCSSEIIQNLQIITYLDLQIEDGINEGLRFIAPIFPCESPSYLVPKQLFELKLKQFNALVQNNLIIGQRFKTHRGQQLFNMRGFEVKVEQILPLEDDFMPSSLWLNVIVSQVNQVSIGNRQRNPKASDIQTQRVNIWDLVLDGPNGQQNLSKLSPDFLQSAFDEDETERLIDCINLNLEKNDELKQLFKQRVPEDIADDYRSYICHESYLDLIIERLKNNYYRSKESLDMDCEQIVNCSDIYNGPTDDLTLKARNQIDKIKKDLKNQLLNKKPKTEQVNGRENANVLIKQDRQGVSLILSNCSIELGHKTIRDDSQDRPESKRQKLE